MGLARKAWNALSGRRPASPDADPNYRSQADLVEHMALYEKITARNPASVDFDRLLSGVRKVGLLVSRANGDSYWQNLPPLFAGKEIVFLGEHGWDAADLFFVSGIGHMVRPALEKIYLMNAPCYVIEETFIKSVVPGAMNVHKDIPFRYFKAVSYVLDSRGPAFYPGIVTQLEHDLNSPFEVPAADLAKARSLIDRIVSQGLSKYNCQPDRAPERLAGGKRKVLVIDQAYKDFSVCLSGGDEASFAAMLERAIDENPGAEIIVKAHVDKSSRDTYFTRKPLPANVVLYREQINPIRLLQSADTVYTFSSTMGWEALLCGKRVHVFGSPISAGWGLTEDRRPFASRRTRKRSLEELFFFLYMRAARYIDPETSKPCSIDRAIDFLIEQRALFLREFGDRYA